MYGSNIEDVLKGGGGMRVHHSTALNCQIMHRDIVIHKIMKFDDMSGEIISNSIESIVHC